MAFLKVIILFVSLATVVLSKPASNEQLDNASVNDPSINAVAVKKSDELTKKDTSVEISGITTGVEPTPSETPSLFKPQRAGTMFARFIDDIFQIPITVLQSVAKLITNPFTTSKKTTPEATIEQQ
ncbi:uncharacterized protein LOC126266220 [Aethina tumida]|uniref:uncharacterized protein LOC126266220 n=1 Tax=Aethina tumida TaxID=116153 RepID=UPI0021472570|nr:uncharacterized protein LOC126266220 [Aethina tumida]XP_049825707.1 uncharacterized protein LOC126266220 [Aethina tumida]